MSEQNKHQFLVLLSVVSFQAPTACFLLSKRYESTLSQGDF